MHNHMIQVWVQDRVAPSLAHAHSRYTTNHEETFYDELMMEWLFLTGTSAVSTTLGVLNSQQRTSCPLAPWGTVLTCTPQETAAPTERKEQISRKR